MRLLGALSAAIQVALAADANGLSHFSKSLLFALKTDSGVAGRGRRGGVSSFPVTRV